MFVFQTETPNWRDNTTFKIHTKQFKTIYRSKSNQNEKKPHKFEKSLIEDKFNSVHSKRCRS